MLPYLKIKIRDKNLSFQWTIVNTRKQYLENSTDLGTEDLDSSLAYTCPCYIIFESHFNFFGLILIMDIKVLAP